MSTSSSSSKLCFNSKCKNLKSERPRKAWRLRSGELAELCDRCGAAYEEGRYCESFHSNALGWSNCESCGKRVHCGCIVSAHAYAFLDAGGIECINCARKSFIVPPNLSWSTSLFFHSPLHERLNKDLPVRNWSQLAGSGPVPWRQAPSLFGSSTHSDLRSRLPYDVDILPGVDRPNASENLSSSLEKKKIEDSSERLINGSFKLGSCERPENGNIGNSFQEQASSSLSKSQQLASLNEDRSTSQAGLVVPYGSTNEASSQIGISASSLRPTPPPLPKQSNVALQSSETQICNGSRPRVDSKGRSQLLPRYRPRITDQELQQISRDSNSVTPLFEKMLSASDAGRIGRLVLPKKCAEAYFPPISQPEGLPLKVQDVKGNEWIFQFRFWPNNNSRMYVLEGVTPCIQNMQLQAGDIVTFSRLEPEGKLVMGFRKASAAPSSDQDNEVVKTDKKMPGDGELADPSIWSKVDKSGYIAKEVLGAKASVPRKRKNSSIGSKSKRLRLDTEDPKELKLTSKEAQGLLRPPNHSPNVVVIEGIEFEEYEDAPILGKPTIFVVDSGKRVQWAQCDDCLKWRKLPANAILSSEWKCSGNSWDPDRSSCSVPQEFTTEQLENLLPHGTLVANTKLKAAKQESDNAEALEGLDTLANLAILGEGEVLPTSAQATTKHPRHRPGCSCIVCIQPPSGKGPKHKQSCTCNVCLTVKRRFRTLMMRRERKQSGKEAETTRKKQQQPSPNDKSGDEDPLPCSDAGSTLKQMDSVEQQALPMHERPGEVDPLPFSDAGNSSLKQQNLVDDGCADESDMKPSTSPFKGQFDLNIQPEREEEFSPGSDSSNIMRMLQDATAKYLRQQGSSGTAEIGTLGGHHTESVGVGSDEKLSNGVCLDSNNQNAENHTAASSIQASASTSSAG